MSQINVGDLVSFLVRHIADGARSNITFLKRCRCNLEQTTTLVHLPVIVDDDELNRARDNSRYEAVRELLLFSFCSDLLTLDFVRSFCGCHGNRARSRTSDARYRRACARGKTKNQKKKKKERIIDFDSLFDCVGLIRFFYSFVLFVAERKIGNDVCLSCCEPPDTNPKCKNCRRRRRRRL